MSVSAYALLLGLCVSGIGLGAVKPEDWVPARWTGGPLEVARRAQDKALADPAVREALSRWYEPSTLDLVAGSPVNCLLVTLTAGGPAQIEAQQHKLVGEYARLARERGLAVVGVVHPGAEPAAASKAVRDAGLDGVFLEGDFPGGTAFADEVRKALSATQSNAIVIHVASSAAHGRREAAPVLAVKGVPPGAVKMEDNAVTAGASGGQWIDSNLWLVGSYRLGPDWRPVWVSHVPSGASSQPYLRSVADSAAAGGRWILALDDGLRAGLWRKDESALSVWRDILRAVAFYESNRDWRSYAPFGKIAIVPYSGGPNEENAEEYLNLIARQRIPYAVIERGRLPRTPLGGYHAVVALTLSPPTDAERKALLAYASKGGMVLAGPSWGGAPADQSYTVVQAGRGGVAVYREESPDAQKVTRDLFDLLVTEEFGVNVFDAPSVLVYVSTAGDGKRMLIHLVNYADQPADSISLWVHQDFTSARLFAPGAEPLQIKPRQSGGRIEISLQGLRTCAALLLE
ncbi:MAG: hypothetical protein ACE141_08915 [Bryobacteraceae bacterium]